MRSRVATLALPMCGVRIRFGAARSGLVGGSIDGDLTWTLTLGPALKARFQNEEITDIFFVISYTALLA